MSACTETAIPARASASAFAGFPDRRRTSVTFSQRHAVVYDYDTEERHYVLSNLAQQLNQDGPKVLLFPTAGDMRAAARDADLETAAGDTDMHAGEFEVSLLLHVDPRLVLPGYEDTDWETLEWRSGLLVRGMKAFAPGGVIGRPSAGSAEKGRRILDALSVSFGERLAYLRAAAAGADRDA